MLAASQPAPVEVLPTGYQTGSPLQLSHRGLRLLLMAVAVVMLAGCIAIVWWAVVALRPEYRGVVVWFPSAHLLPREPGDIQGEWLAAVIITSVSFLINASLLATQLHERAHGYAIRRLSGAEPCYSFSPLRSYSYAPGWFFPRRDFAIVLLVPLAAVSAGLVVALLVLLLIPPGPIMAIPVALITFMFGWNAAGALGDIMAVGWLLLRLPPGAYISSTGIDYMSHTPPVPGSPPPPQLIGTVGDS